MKNNCHCGKKLPVVTDDKTQYQFCSTTCRIEHDAPGLLRASKHAMEYLEKTNAGVGTWSHQTYKALNIALERIGAHETE